MICKSLKIDLLDDLVLSQTAATSGDHQSLDYIPGSALLGLVARAYQDFTEEEQWQVFHSGQLRFSNAYPLSAEGDPSYPIPLSFHYPKGEEYIQNMATGRKSLTDKVVNLAAISRSDLMASQTGIQPKQLRSGYLTEKAEWLSTRKSRVLKTAVNPETGTAAEGQLYSYDAIEKGQVFGARLDADDGLSESLVDKVCRLLMIAPRIGRSRSAQFGRVKIVCHDVRVPVVTQGNEQSLVLLLVADMALQNSNGFPILHPTAEALGIKNAQLQPALTHIRVRSYSTYNAWRQSYDSERQVIAVGSVLRYVTDKPLTPDDIHQLERGIGMGTESGLGRVLVNPPWLMQQNPKVFPLSGRSEESTDVVRPTTDLMKWLNAQSCVDQFESVQSAKKYTKELCELYRSAHSYMGAVLGVDVGPSDTQWGRVYEVVKRPGIQMAQVKTALFGDGQPPEKNDTRICKGDDWTTTCLDKDGEFTSFTQWLNTLVQLLSAGDNSAQAISILQQLARQAKSTEVAKARQGKGAY